MLQERCRNELAEIILECPFQHLQKILVFICSGMPEDQSWASLGYYNLQPSLPSCITIFPTFWRKSYELSVRSNWFRSAGNSSRFRPGKIRIAELHLMADTDRAQAEESAARINGLLTAEIAQPLILDASDTEAVITALKNPQD